jgi:photosynthetic reaction center cytochrome c subunit
MKVIVILGFVVTATFTLAQTGPPERPPMAEQVFKNVQVLKGIPVDEFMNTMGIFSAALGMSCEDCHAANDSKWENYALDTSTKKRTARRMIQMVNAINKDHFGGRAMITCWTCHRGGDRPKVTPNLDTLYNLPDEPNDVIVAAPGAPAADGILDKYIQALGGAQRVGALTSFVAKGTSTGYGPEGNARPVEIYAKAPNQRTVIIHTLNGDSTTVYDGRAGWIAAPLRPVAVLSLSGGTLEGARLDAELSFPARIKQLFSNWKVGFPTTLNERDVQVVQGTASGGSLGTLYFDNESGLLVRFVRYSDSIVGRSPTQIDYSDYRDVAGVKMPFRFTVTWLDGKETFELTDLQPSVSIDATKFARPR